MRFPNLNWVNNFCNYHYRKKKCFLFFQNEETRKEIVFKKRCFANHFI